MSYKFIFIISNLFVYSIVYSLPTNDTANSHGHSQYAVDNCDDTIHGIGIDWDGEDTFIDEKNYLCTNKSMLSTPLTPFAHELCKTPPMGYHVCLNEKITYTEKVPIGGPHRPVWVTYGEYKYMPPQRWIHAIEHGAAAFLYNPCADKNEIEALKFLAKNCLRRHIISPYKNLHEDELFNVVTFGCRLKLNKIIGQESIIADYLRRHAIKDGPEFHIIEDGDYNFGLIEKAEIISDLKDSKICHFMKNK